MADPVHWLHISDIHMGCRGNELWWQVHQEFAASVREMAKRLGTPDMILISGDLAWQGRKEEYGQFDQFLTELRKWVKKSPGDLDPLVIPVPGNHDLDRNETLNDELQLLSDMLDTSVWSKNLPRLEKKIWENPLPTPFQAPFKNYLEWFEQSIKPALGAACRTSRFPGDLAVTVNRPRKVPLTIVGLNSAWMHYQQGDFEGKLELLPRQLQEVLPDNSLDGSARLLMMHHPLPWFSTECQKKYLETIYHPERFQAALVGHAHTGSSELFSPFGAVGRCTLMAPSLFGLEQYGTAQESRSMGYQWGSLSQGGEIRIWPMKRVERGGGQWAFDRDTRYEKHDDRTGLLIRSTTTKPSSPVRDLTPWLQSLLDRTGKLAIRGISSGAGRSREAGLYDIETLYTPLHSSDRRDNKALSLAELLPHHRRLLIEGQPGAGKTTFLKLVAAMLAKDHLALPCADGSCWRHRYLGLPCSESARIPLFLRLSELTALLADDKPPFTDDRRRLLDLLDRTPNADPAWRDEWTRQLEEGEAMLLLDGLDEVADEGIRERVLAIVQDALRHWSKSQVVITSRPFGVGRIKELGFHSVVIDPFGQEEIREFISRWVTALHAQDKPDHQQILLQAIVEKPAIRRLAANPVMLTCLCVVHWNEGKLPEGRGRVYQAVLRWLIAARSALRDQAGYPDRFAQEAFAALALAMMRGSKRAVFDVQEGAEAVEPLVGRYFQHLRSKAERLRLGREWLRFECLGSGIVEELGDKKLKFWHLTFQEYLASQALAWLGDGEEGGEEWWPVVREHLTDAQWRESVALLPGSLFDEGGGLRVDRLLQRVLALRGNDPTLAEDARVAGIMGRLLEPMTAYQYRPPAEIDAVYRQLLQRVMDIFSKEGAAQVAIATRIEAAEALGQGGDPRLSQLNLIEIPGTGWQLGKYLVTVAEYQHFVEEGGYQEPRWWDEAGWDEVVSQGWQNPSSWGEQLLYPNRPVVAVSWFEAMAYCRWLSEQKKMEIRLPDELLWTKANKGKYPWGNERPAPELANFAKRIGSPTPVGLYPAGDGPFGHCDLAGNVWEWQRNLYTTDKNTGTHLDPEDMKRETVLVLLGGSWGSSDDALLSSCRFRWCRAGELDLNVGFRLAARL
ncbi:MAG: SUMF1/EgtB/PvdO family nonheme iron enzyme [Magnetococcales bacterium]|nr:SUMF1/EgtB/PvdO family nonheme iron enzyme [Magnetococcales bacterium]